MAATHTHSPGPWKWVDEGGYWTLVDANGRQVMDDGSACGEYNREIEPDSPDGRLVADSPAAALAMELICAGVAEISSRWVTSTDDPSEAVRCFCFDGKHIVMDMDNWTSAITAIGWDRCREALAAARGGE